MSPISLGTRNVKSWKEKNVKKKRRRSYYSWLNVQIYLNICISVGVKIKKSGVEFSKELLFKKTKNNTSINHVFSISGHTFCMNPEFRMKTKCSFLNCSFDKVLVYFRDFNPHTLYLQRLFPYQAVLIYKTNICKKTASEKGRFLDLNFTFCVRSRLEHHLCISFARMHFQYWNNCHFTFTKARNTGSITRWNP